MVELFAIVLALEWAEDMPENEILICCDSVSAPSSIKSGEAKHHQELIYDIMFIKSRLSSKGKNVTFVRNESADRLAKEALKKETVEVTIPLSKSEGKSLVQTVIRQQWQQYWDDTMKGRQLHSIKNKVGTFRSRGTKCKEQVKMTRLKLGRSNLNSTLFITGKHLTGLCEHCNETETVEHILTSCRRFTQERQEMMRQFQKSGQIHRNSKSILQQGDHVEGRNNILNLLRSTGLERRL